MEIAESARNIFVHSSRRAQSSTRAACAPGVRGVLSDGNDGSGFDGSCLGLVGDQLAQERNQHDERNTDREAAGAKLGEELRVPGVGGDRRGAGRLGDHSRKVACKERREAGPKHPAAHHHALILPRREFADHRVSDRRDEQLTDALQHVAHEQPHERTLAVGAGQLDAERENEKRNRHQQQRRRELLRYVDSPPVRAHAGEERREHRPAEHDANGVDVLNPLRLNLHGTDHQVDVVDREQHQAARRHLVERPEHQRADGQDQVGRHVALLAAIRVADREVDQSERDRAADSLDDRLGSAGSLEHEPHNGDETDENADASELAQPELLRRRVEQRRIAVGQRFPVEEGEDDGDEVADRSEDEEARVTLGGLEMACDAEPDEEADIHAGVVPEECSFAARVLRGEALREHHVDAGDVEAAAGEEKCEADVEQRKRAGRDACAAEHLQRHAADKQVPVREEAAAQVTAEEVQAVVECAEHTHQRGGLFHAEMQMLRRVEDQRRVENSEAERRKDLNEEQRSRSLRSLGEAAFEKFHPALLCRSTCRVMSSRACDVSRVVAATRARIVSAFLSRNVR